MDYSLAKRLKDSGFPQVGYPVGIGTEDNPETAVIPSLEEFIEACGEGYHNLERGINSYIGNWYCNFYDDDGQTFWSSSGKTPKEAVANLWLLLNEKKV